MPSHSTVLATALFVAAAVAGFLFYQHTGEEAPRTAPETDHKAAMRPVFSLPDLDGNVRSITEWDGQPTIVNFWATWCPPCLREIPLLIEKRDEAAAQGIAIIGIAMDDPDAVADFAAENDFNYPVLVGEQVALDAAEGYGAEVVGLPLTVYVDSAGEVLEIHAGELTLADLEEAIALLARGRTGVGDIPAR